MIQTTKISATVRPRIGVWNAFTFLIPRMLRKVMRAKASIINTVELAETSRYSVTAYM